MNRNGSTDKLRIRYCFGHFSTSLRIMLSEYIATTSLAMLTGIASSTSNETKFDPRARFRYTTHRRAVLRGM